MPILKRRERAVVGLALAGLVVVALYLYVVEPLVYKTRDLAEVAPARETTLESRRRLVAQQPRLSQELAEVTQALERESARFLPGATPSLAASELQKVVKDVAAAANVEVRSERVMPPADMGGLQEVPIELTVAGNIRETVTLLTQIERTPRLLTIKDVKLRVVAVGQPRGLLTTLTIAGYLLRAPATGSN